MVKKTEKAVHTICLILPDVLEQIEKSLDDITNELMPLYDRVQAGESLSISEESRGFLKLNETEISRIRDLAEDLYTFHKAITKA